MCAVHSYLKLEQTGISLSGQPISGATGGVALDKNAVDFQSEETVNSDPQTIRFPGYLDITIGQEATVVPIVLTNQITVK